MRSRRAIRSSSTTRASGRAIYGLALLVAIAAVQVRAEFLQWWGGYRPFSHAPARAPYSWDMFAIRLERCAIRWDPPLEIEGRRVSTWHDRSFPIEFDTVYNRARDYYGAARTGCAFRSEPKTVTTVVCVHGDGHIDEGSAECP